jgi:hypothetical protein
MWLHTLWLRSAENVELCRPKWLQLQNHWQAYTLMWWRWRYQVWCGRKCTKQQIQPRIGKPHNGFCYGLDYIKIVLVQDPEKLDSCRVRATYTLHGCWLGIPWAAPSTDCFRESDTIHLCVMLQKMVRVSITDFLAWDEACREQVITARTASHGKERFAGTELDKRR